MRVPEGFTHRFGPQPTDAPGLMHRVRVQLHISMFVKWPGDPPVGRIETLVSQIDVFPTMLEAAEVPFEGEATSLDRHLEDSGSDESRNVTVEFTWDALPNRGATIAGGVTRRAPETYREPLRPGR